MRHLMFEGRRRGWSKAALRVPLVRTRVWNGGDIPLVVCSALIWHGRVGCQLRFSARVGVLPTIAVLRRAALPRRI
jgi:hypothetical protein